MMTKTNSPKMSLFNATKNITLSARLNKTGGVFSRMKGLIGSPTLSNDQSLWIPACNSIHTLFMNYPIDVVFTDKNLVVKAIHQNIKPWKPLLCVWGAFHTFEFLGGSLNQTSIAVGDQLNVGN